ncbi:hypothetical protein AAG570_002862 [Ranatra chinensis]
MKIVRPQVKQPANMVKFITSVQMTDYDIKNYLEKIYKVPVANVRSEIVEGELKRSKLGYIIKDDDYRAAYITLKKGETFKFPDICEEKQKKDESDFKKAQEQAKVSYEAFTSRNKKRPGVPGWFSF